MSGSMLGLTAEDQYLLLLERLHGQGILTFPKGDRTGTGTQSTFGVQLDHEMKHGFPVITTKRLSWKLIVSELLWFLSGDTNIKALHAVNNTIWDEWADEDGNLGPVYGQQWRSWPDNYGQTLDQIQNLCDRLKADPDCRRQLVTAWNPTDLPIPGVAPQHQPGHGKQALAPCHTLFQTWTREDSEGQRYISLGMYQRSADSFLGVPFNIASYALLLEILAVAHGMIPERFVHTFGDLHLYNNHFDQAGTQLKRSPRELPTVRFSKEDAVAALQGKLKPVDWERFELIGYDPHSSIAAKVAV